MIRLGYHWTWVTKFLNPFEAIWGRVRDTDGSVKWGGKNRASIGRMTGAAGGGAVFSGGNGGGGVHAVI